MRTLSYICLHLTLLVVLQCITQPALGQDYDVYAFPYNSDEADFSGVFYKDQFIFASTRDTKTMSFIEDGSENYLTDLYTTDILPGNEIGKIQALAGNVNSGFNEGQSTYSSDGRQMFFTGNLEPVRNGKIKTEDLRLGLFMAEFENGSWIRKNAFVHNAPALEYSVAHPSLSSNDSILYFASNCPGGYGGSDIYCCYWNDGEWSKPKNLGKTINTKGNEFFPFINEFGFLFFSSDARPDSQGLDIYYSLEQNGVYINPVRLNETINTEYDEFAYSERRGSQMGCFSSNREDGGDDLFLFTKYIGDLKECHDNESGFSCYMLSGGELPPLINSHFAYEWNLGDGALMYGDSVEHCYRDPGAFKIVLNVVDTNTHEVFVRIGEIDINVRAVNRPYIQARDTVYTGIPVELAVDLGTFNAFQTEQVKWEISDGAAYRGTGIIHQFRKTGSFQVKCTLAGKNYGHNQQPRICVFKNVFVVDAPASADTPLIIPCCNNERRSALRIRPSGEIQQESESSSTYRLVIKRSDLSLAFSDTTFRNITTEISELRAESGFDYMTGEADEWGKLIALYEEILTRAGVACKAERVTRPEYNARLVRKGSYASALVMMEQALLSEDSMIVTRLVLTSSPDSLKFSDAIFSKTNHEIIETADTSGFYYSVENTAGGKRFDLLLEEARSAGFADAKIVNKSGREWRLTERKRGRYKSSMFVQESLSSYRILLTHSSMPLPASDVIFSKVDQEITELKVTDGYDYVIESAATWQELTPKLEEMRESGFASAEIKSYDKGLQENRVVQPSLEAEEAKPTRSLLYTVVILKSDTRIPFNNDLFSSLDENITEMRQAGKTGFQYAIRSSSKPGELDPLARELKEQAFPGAAVDSMTLEDFSSRLVKIGKFIKPKNAASLNVEFAKLSDIKFEYNSAHISPDSYPKLNYIASMLLLEEDFSLRLAAHTCNIGSQAYNAELSTRRADAVVAYLLQKGIAHERLFAKGYGSTKPKTSNDNAEGQKQNRRVEFIIVFNRRITP